MKTNRKSSIAQRLKLKKRTKKMIRRISQRKLRLKTKTTKPKN